ncbi:MAG: hypothetical protein ACE5JX_15475 [Acidobacteriota bacterium]
MSPEEALNRICALLEERYGDFGRGAGNRLRQWISGRVPRASPEMLEKHLEARHLELLFDAFWQVLPFGTGGRRGKVGYGCNRLNPATVAMTVQGHCDYLWASGRQDSERSVVVANDVRVFNDIAGVYDFLGQDHPLLGVSSRSLGRLACEIYGGNGVVAYFADPAQAQAMMTTPELSYLIDQLGAAGGINLSASHNPPDDNGIKVYDSYGSQPVAPEDQRLVDAMEKATDVRSLPFEEALEQGFIRDVPAPLHQAYIETYVNLYEGIESPRSEIPVVYTPLCGSGLTTVGDVLRRLGFPLIVPPEQGPDGTFGVIPFKAPNPEVPQSTQLATAFADREGAGIVLSSDPDADRVGVEVKLGDGSWYHFDGNQIAALLCYFLMLDPQGPCRKGLVIETLVTTKILGRIVEEAGDSCCIDDLLVGFKYVADVLKRLARTGRYRNLSSSPEQLVLAAEESHGIMMIPTIRDKDATPAAMYLAALHQRLCREDRNLLDYYVQILEELGGYDNVSRSILMAGAEGMLRKARIMRSLRSSPPKVLGGQPVLRVVDYWDEEIFGTFASETEKLPRNVIQIFTDAFVITVRPSGTEPKLKLYCQLLPQGEPSTARGISLLREVRAQAEKISRLVYNDLLGRIDFVLGQAAMLLPDIVDLDRKRHFERVTTPHLLQALEKGSFRRLSDLLSWLREEATGMTPGANPLPALKAPVACLCRQWVDRLPATSLRSRLRDWAQE